MTYSAKLNEDNQYRVSYNPPPTYSVKSDLKVTLMAQSMSDLSDVITNNLNSSTNNYVLTYDSVNNRYVFVDPDVVLLAAANLPTNQVTSSGVPTAFANNIIDSAIEPIDGGNF